MLNAATHVRPDLNSTFVRLMVAYKVHRLLRELDDELLLQFLQGLDDPFAVMSISNRSWQAY